MLRHHSEGCLLSRLELRHFERMSAVATGKATLVRLRLSHFAGPVSRVGCHPEYGLGRLPTLDLLRRLAVTCKLQHQWLEETFLLKDRMPRAVRETIELGYYSSFLAAQATQTWAATAENGDWRALAKGQVVAPSASLHWKLARL
eukprot:5276509-Amphidinium_carterae.2